MTTPNELVDLEIEAELPNYTLEQLDVVEVSLVDKAANKRKFLVLKQYEDTDNMENPEDYSAEEIDAAMQRYVTENKKPDETMEQAEVRLRDTPEYKKLDSALSTATMRKPKKEPARTEKAAEPDPYETDSWNEIEQKARNLMLADGGELLTKEQAIDAVLKTPVGKQLNEKHEQEMEANFKKMGLL